TCHAGVCDDNNMPADTPCSAEPTCNPDRCDANAICIDSAALADNMACSDNGGTLCCAGACSLAAASCNACSLPATGPLNIAILESQSISTTQKMDEKWKAIAESLGHTATIQPQTFLDDIHNLDNVDILIHTSHDILVPQARRDVITAFVNQGKG